MNKASALAAFLLIPASVALSAVPTTPPPEKKEMNLHVEPKAGLPEQTNHFTIEAYGTTAANKAQILENAYLRFFDATGLTSFEMPQKIHVLIFENRREFKTKLERSRKNVVTGEHTLATFEQPNLDRLLVTNVTKMMLEMYAGRKFKEDENWIRMGLVESVVVLVGDEDPTMVRERWRSFLKRTGPVSVSQLTGKEFVVAEENQFAQTEFEKEKSHPKEKSLRRLQTTAASLVLFLREWGGQFNFAFFLSQLRDNKSLDDAVALAYPGKFRNMSELYNFWLNEDVGEIKKPDPTQR